MASNKGWKWATTATQLASNLKESTLVKGVVARGEDALTQYRAKRRGSMEEQPNPEVINVALFPGWATRRFKVEGKQSEEFNLDIYVSGFATSLRTPETRAQRAFIRVAKGFASLPKNGPTPAVTPSSENPPHLSRSTEDLLAHVHLPPRPDEISEESEIAALEQQYARLEFESQQDDASIEGVRGTSTAMTPTSSTSSANPPMVHTPGATTPMPNTSIPFSAMDPNMLAANLTARLKPFLASVVANRHIRLSIYTSPHKPDTHPSVVHEPQPEPDSDRHAPLAVAHVVTSNVGSFHMKMTVPWKDLCQHPGGVFIAYSDGDQRHRLHVLAELLPMVDSASAAPLPVSIQSTLSLPLSDGRVRVISDIDDTVKLSNILGGARTVFQNVFCKGLEDLVIPGMSDWYNNMAKRGVHFHYVSNGPYQLLPVINEFITLSSLPEGSVRLRSYTGRSLFNGLLSAPMTRKRAAVVDVLSSFEHSQFFLVGDSGEQDLELYATLAAERPQQILGIFIRDASGDDSRPLEDPTGSAVMSGITGQGITDEPSSLSSNESAGSGSSSSSASSSMYEGEKTGTIRIQTGPNVSGGLLTPRPQNSRKRSWNPMKRSSVGSTSSGDYFTQPQEQQTDPASPLRYGFTPNAQLPPPARAPSLNSANSTSSIPSLPLMPSMAQVHIPRALRTPSPRSWSAMAPADRRRVDLQMRVYKARLGIPESIPFRVFRHASECVEAGELLDRLNASS